jgi:hypothetical protein
MMPAKKEFTILIPISLEKVKRPYKKRGIRVRNPLWASRRARAYAVTFYYPPSYYPAAFSSYHTPILPATRRLEKRFGIREEFQG